MTGDNSFRLQKRLEKNLANRCACCTENCAEQWKRDGDEFHLGTCPDSCRCVVLVGTIVEEVKNLIRKEAR